MKYSGPPVTAAPKKLVVAKLLKNTPISWNLEGSFPYSQEATTGS